MQTLMETVRRNFSLLVLFLLMGCPMVLANLGWRLLAGWERDRALRGLEEEAGRALDSLAATWHFKHQMKLGSERFQTRMGSLLTHRGATVSFGKAAREALAKPFPRFQLWAFELDPESPVGGSRLRYSNGHSSVGRRSLEMTFDYLRAHYAGGTLPGGRDRQAARMMEKLFGPYLPAASLAVFEKGRPVRVLYRKAIHYLLWDTVQIGGKPSVGYLLLVRDDQAAVQAGFSLAQHSLLAQFPGFFGFLRVAPTKVGDIVPRLFLRSRRFGEWRRRWGGRVSSRFLERGGVPWGTALGKWLLYARGIPNSTHLGFIAFPEPFRAGIPIPLALGNLLFLGAWILVLARGKLLGAWPQISLSHRFYGLYALAAAIPLTLGILALIGYRLEARDVVVRDLQRNLELALADVDQGKNEMENRYLAAFYRLARRPDLQQDLARFGLKAPRLLERAQAEFGTGSGSLPLLVLAYFDAWGGQEAWRMPGSPPEETEGHLSFYRVALTRMLRRNLAATGAGDKLGPSPLREQDEALAEGYYQISGSVLDEVMEEKRGMVFTATFGGRVVHMILEFIQVGELNTHGLMAVWRDTDLEASILRDTAPRFYSSLRFGTLMAFRREAGMLKELLPCARPHRKVLEMAEGAWRAGKSVVFPFGDGDQWLGVAVPSRSMPETVLVGTVDLAGALDATRGKVARLGALLALAFIGVLVLGKAMGRRVVPAVVRIREGLARVGKGDYHVRLSLPRADELGQLSQAFDEMTEGLRQRHELASLVSEKAVEAVSESPGQGPAIQGIRTEAVILVSDIRSFTTLCESRSVHEVTSLLDRHLDVMSPVLDKWRGSIDHVIGDAIQAAFEGPDAGNRAVAAALEMLQAMDRIQAARAERGEFPYRIGVGVAQGTVIFGGLGDPNRRFCLTHIGPPVNLAFRMETLSKEAKHLPLVIHRDVVLEGAPFIRRLIPMFGHEDDARIFPSHPRVRPSEIAEWLTGLEKV